ncbi:MAG: hypothetical protein ACRBBP_08350 [Bdellovibrionales bacterium]
MGQYGLEFKVIETLTEAEAHEAIERVHGYGRSYVTKWYEDDISDCATVTHEILHSLGLVDEYFEEGSCKTKAFEAQEVSPYSIMEMTSDYYETIHLMPRHMLAILEQAIPSILIVSHKSDTEKDVVFPNCITVVEKSFLGMTREKEEPLSLGEDENFLFFMESGESEYQRAFEWEYDFIRRPEVVLQTIKGENLVEMKCPGLHEAQSLADVGKALSSDEAVVELLPFSFDDHEACPLLYYLGRDRLDELPSE